MLEITITCHDGTRLRLSEWRDAAPHKGEVVETVETGQKIKAMIDVCREEKVGVHAGPFSKSLRPKSKSRPTPLPAAVATNISGSKTARRAAAPPWVQNSRPP
jgi:hypothetical protein